jgi:UDP-N-acetylglucosamine/UDP-N-acetylgalactosamine diphosphorylase
MRTAWFGLLCVLVPVGVGVGQTSIVTHGATEDFFRRHSYFGLPSSDIYFFRQSELPALNLQGRILLERRSKVSLAPNGNGGIFEGLRRQGALDDITARGVQYVHVYGVDNVLALVGDPTFVGFAVERGADCANKVVLKVRRGEESRNRQRAGVAATRQSRHDPPVSVR